MRQRVRAKLDLVTRSPEETQEMGRTLGRNAQAGDVLLLLGELGSGKTTLVQGIAWGLGVQERARSPTFVLVAQYQGRLLLFHIDLYRIGGSQEALDLGLDDCFEGQGVSVVEWADRAWEALPAEHLEIWLEDQNETKRLIHLVARGTRYKELLGSLTGFLKEDRPEGE